jgi:HPt (histidine-containing phosphotransfer) domain-containing protein
MTSEAFKQVLEELGAEFRDSLPVRLSEVQQVWSVVAAGPESAVPPMELLRFLHSLAGSAKTFGLPAVTDAAKAAENFLEPFCTQCNSMSAMQREEFERLLAALKQSVPRH